jgi:hypothetical protein
MLGFQRLKMIERLEFRAQMARLQLTVADVAERTGLSKNCIRGFLNGADIRLTSFLAITEALGGEVMVSFPQIEEPEGKRPQIRVIRPPHTP